MIALIYSMALISSSTASFADWPLRFTCEDGRPFAEEFASATKDMQEHLMRLRELAILATNGSISSTERGYLDDEAQARRGEIQRLISETQYEDSFMEKHFAMLDGIEFLLSYRSIVTRAYLVAEYKIPRITMNALGRPSRAPYWFNDDRTNDAPLSKPLKLNGISIRTPNTLDDAISHERHWASAVAWARSINEVAGLTSVNARAQTTRFGIQIDPVRFPVSLSNLEINGAHVGGTASDLFGLFRAINDAVMATAVNARSGLGISQLELYALDGRNISVSIGNDQNLYNLFSGGIPLGDGAVTMTSRVLLISSGEIRVDDPSGLLGQTTSFLVPRLFEGLSALDLTTRDMSLISLDRIDASIVDLNKQAAIFGRILSSCPEQ